jgi:5-methylcytosine-specific restriction endonuclease McrA
MLDDAKKELDNNVLSIMGRVDKHLSVIEKNIKKTLKEYKCNECSKDFFSVKKKRYCSDSCLNKRSNRVKEIKRRTKLKENGKIDYTITIDKLIKRDKRVCKICGDKVNKKDFITTDEGYFIAGDYYPSIDHILPVSKGGTHTWDNVQLAHRICNTDKRDNEMYEHEGQLTLSI